MRKFSLIENANDSLEHALQHMRPVNTNSAGDWKRIILDLAHVVDLLFKERLRRAHPAFVLENIDKYPSSDAFTVGAEKALKRVQTICNIQFSKDALSAVDTARKKETISSITNSLLLNTKQRPWSDKCSRLYSALLTSI